MACIPRCMGQRPTFVSMMFLTSSFFVVEIVVGYITRSMALIADSFHMLSDIISLIVGYFALKYSCKTNANILVANTFGFVRAEVLGALINAVFLIALCFSITIEALQRMIETEELKNPILILSIGAAGLFINLIGMLLFHGHAGHGHSHGGHGHSHGGHGHSHGGHGHSHGGHGHNHNDGNDGQGHSHNGKKVIRKNNKKKIERDMKENLPGFQNNDCGQSIQLDDDAEEKTVAVTKCKENENNVTIEMYMETFPKADTGKKPASSGQMNMKAVYLHILGDALGSVIVIIAALIVYFFHGKWTLYVDPVLSLVLVLIMLKTTVPLLKESSRILLQNVPSHIQLRHLEEKLLAEFPEILAIHDFHVWQLTENKIVASLHAKFVSDANYKSLSTSLKEFFHDEGIHSTTVQPEFVEEGSDDERECLLRCESKTCEEKLCCVTDQNVEIINNEQAFELPKISENQPVNASMENRLGSVELLSVTALDDVVPRQ